ARGAGLAQLHLGAHRRARPADCAAGPVPAARRARGVRPEVEVRMSVLLELAGVTRRFGGLNAVSGVDLSVHQGEIIGLIGPNGAGKTTLVNVITGVHRASAGAVRFA